MNGLRSDGGDVESHVLIGLGDFDQHPAAGFAQRSGAGDHRIGAFDGFHGDDVFVFDGDGLADIQLAHLLGDVPSQLDVGLGRG